MSELWEELKKLAVPAKHFSPRKWNPRQAPNCDDKKSFRSKKHARDILQDKRAGFRAKIYKCENCDTWHIANRDKAAKMLWEYKRAN